jgi:hypothetical protein
MSEMTIQDLTGVAEWFPFDQPEPRLAHIQWIRHIPTLAKVLGIFHYRLGINVG